jgi:hypothetical protein
LPPDYLDVVEPAFSEPPACYRGAGSVGTRFAVRQIDEPVLGEVGRERHTEKSALTSCQYCGDAGKRFRKTTVTFDDPQPSGSFRYQHASIRQKRETPRTFKSVGDWYDVK